MANGETPSSNTDEPQSNKPNIKPPYLTVLAQVVSKTKNEPFLLVIGVAALLVGLAISGSQIGSSDLRVIVIVIGLLAFVVIVGYYVQAALRLRPTPQRTPKPEPTTPPVLPESKQFAELPSFSEKKEMLIHPFEARLDSGEPGLSDEQLHRCVASPWDFDRIVAYLQEERSTLPSFRERLSHVKKEWEKLRASEGRRSLIPLHYAVRSILTFLQNTKPSREAQASLPLFDEISTYLKARPEIDQGGEVKSNLTLVSGILGKRAK